jgi:hypothetical protein
MQPGEITHGARLARPACMKIFAAAVAILTTLCAPALADPAPPGRPESLKIRFTLKDTHTSRTFDVRVGAASPCATASEKKADREIELRACVKDGSRLDVDWSSRSSRGEYHSTSSLPFARGATAELGTADGPRLAVEVQ